MKQKTEKKKMTFDHDLGIDGMCQDKTFASMFSNGSFPLTL